MIISHKYKFIFIKTRKTAGTSVEGALAPICAPDDIITSDGNPLTQADFYTAEARNYAGRFNPVPELLQQRSAVGVARVLRDWYKRPKFYNHIGAPSVRARVDPDIWASYYKFCFERNPWDKMISFYYFVYRNSKDILPLNEYIMNKPFMATMDQHYCQDWNRYAVGDEVIVDRVFDFANVGENVRLALSDAGVPAETIASLTLPHLKSSTRRERGRMSRTAADRIAQIFAREIAHFGYVEPEGMVAEQDDAVVSP